MRFLVFSLISHVFSASSADKEYFAQIAANTFLNEYFERLHRNFSKNFNGRNEKEKVYSVIFSFSCKSRSALFSCAASRIVEAGSVYE